MNVRTRLAFVLGALLLAFALGAFLLRGSHEEQVRSMLASQRDEEAKVLNGVLRLAGQPLKNFAADYSLWDDMVKFMETRDPEWAAINLEASLQNLDANAVWVLRPDGSLVYSATRQLDAALRTPPMPVPEVLPKMQRERFTNFFFVTPDGLLLEVCSAPIQPSDDIRRQSPARGWLLVARHWDDDYLKSASGSLKGSLTLMVPPRPVGLASGEDSTIVLERELKDWRGRTVAILNAQHTPEEVSVLEDDYALDMLIFAGFGVAVILLMLLAVSRWVVSPLQHLEDSMSSNSPVPLGPLRAQDNEFGRLARLAEASFRQRSALQSEVGTRLRTEAALRHSEENLRHSTELRTRLARDLHDSVIQSIYAAGLSIEDARNSLRTEPTNAEQRLDAVLASLNLTIREVRSFITGLEPEHDRPPQFAKALRILGNTLQALHPLRLELEIEEEAAGRLDSREELHALQIVRESVSNALRHSGATIVRIKLRDESGRVVLAVEDDGSGFDTVAATGKGSGLANLASRAAEIGANLRIDSSPGKGTRVVLMFSPTTQT